jgi:D-tyrosyl-tRNA(Tyr) deacylase
VRIVLQRVSRASVRVDGKTTGSVESGLLILIGIGAADVAEDVDHAVEKVANLRIFPDEQSLMNRSLRETGGSALVVSQFTLLADVHKGRRPSFIAAAAPEVAEPLVDRFVAMLKEAGIRTETGIFGAAMEVELVNDGPVTILLEVSEGRVI